MKLFSSALFATFLFFLIGCQQDANKQTDATAEAETTEEAPVAEAAVSMWDQTFSPATFTEEAGTAARSGADAVTYVINTETSEMGWRGKKLLDKSHDGIIMLSEGSLMVAGDMIQAGSITIDMASLKDKDLVDAGAADKATKLEGHLKSPDFFDVANHPTAMLEITSVSPVEGEENMYTIGGNLTIKGATHHIAFPAEVMMEGDNLMAKAFISIDRSKWGVSFGLGGELVADDAIDLYLDLKAAAATETDA